MENKEKKTISTMLMVAGVICILIAGSIFVATAWKYIPEIIKKLCLLGVSIGLFAGSKEAAKHEKLKKTETAFFYLGDAFLGFFMTSLLGGVEQGFVAEQANALRYMISFVVMIVPVIVRFLRRQSAFAAGVAIVMVDNIWMSLAATLKLSFTGCIILLGVVSVLLVIVACATKDMGTKKLQGTVSVFSMLHGISYAVFALIYVIFGIQNEQGVTIVMIALLAAIVGIMKKNNENSGFGVLFHLVGCVAIYGVMDGVNAIAGFVLSWGMVVFFTFLANMLYMLWLMKCEVLIFQICFAILAEFIQMCLFMFINCDVDRLTDGVFRALYMPYAFVAFAGIMLFEYRKNGKLDVASKLVKMALVFFGMSCILFIASVTSSFHSIAFFTILALDVLLLAIVVTNSSLKAALFTVALVLEELAIITQSFVPVPVQYDTEYICGCFGIGIVLLGRIWYHKSSGVRMAQFVSTCLILFALLVNNLDQGNIYNVMILGLTSAVIIVVAAVKNSKRYVIAASVTLILLVLYITRSFWLSIAWWVYLFVAGVVLIALAVKKEKEM